LPLYPYRCTECGHHFEKIQKFSAKPETACPKCGGVLERPLTAPGLQFKGAGWYVNDYAPKSGSSSGDTATGEKKPDAKSEAAKSEGKTETKAESKSETKAAAKAESSPASSSSSSPAPSSSSSTK